MAKNVFFSFHYQDVIDFRANVVRNHWVVSEKQSAAGYFDKSIWFFVLCSLWYSNA